MPTNINFDKKLGVTSRNTSITLPSASGFTNADSLLLGGVVGQHAESNAVYTALNGATNVSFSLWLKPISGGSGLRMVFQIGRGSTGLNSQCQLFLYEGNRIDFSVNASGAYGRGNIGTLTYGSWNHLVVAVDLTHGGGPECQMFLNGADVTIGDNMGTTNSFPTATDELYIGESKTGHYNPLNGNIDEFAIYNGTTLTLAQAQAIYNQGGTAKPGDLSTLSPTPTLWYRMGDSDGGSGTTLTDAAGSANATLINSASYTTDVP
tara:strand:+ start:12 stop:803 length:792 start_codon:yes stop_codon:yes gene_type:complete